MTRERWESEENLEKLFEEEKKAENINKVRRKKFTMCICVEVSAWHQTITEKFILGFFSFKSTNSSQATTNSSYHIWRAWFAFSSFFNLSLFYSFFYIPSFFFFFWYCFWVLWDWSYVELKKVQFACWFFLNCDCVVRLKKWRNWRITHSQQVEEYI